MPSVAEVKPSAPETGASSATTVSTGPDQGSIEAASATPAAPAATTELKFAQSAPSKKKNKGKGKGPGGEKGRPPPAKKTKGTTGFEEYTVDGPLRPEDVEVEKALYSPDKSIQQRFETCIQRYRARRKWDPLRLQLFGSYLTLGGIASGQKQFAGLGKMDQKKVNELDMDAETIAMMRATDYVEIGNKTGSDDEEEIIWEVDFAYVVRGFLSYRVPFVLCYRKQNELTTACKLVRNFLSYILYHNVAPEYEANLREAVQLCDRADRELTLCSNVSNRMPGVFNTACSTIYGGFYTGVGDTDKSWDSVTVDKIAGMDEKMAKELVLIALAKRGTPGQQANGLNRKVTRRDFMSLEVTEVFMPPSERIEGDKSLPHNKYFVKTQALGKIKVRPWIPEDPLEEEAPQLPEDQVEEIEIWLEKGILQFCFPGMHLEARVHRCDDGLIFIDSITAVMVSFYLRLENPEADNDDDDDFD